MSKGDASVRRWMQVLLPLLIFTFGPISGAHFNPMVTATFVATKAMVPFQFNHKTLQLSMLIVYHTVVTRKRTQACIHGNS